MSHSFSKILTGLIVASLVGYLGVHMLDFLWGSNLVFALENSYYAELSGDSEVLPVSTEATGLATFEFSEDNTQLSFTINVSAIDNVLGAHIHQGDESENGPVALTLYNGSDSPEGDISGTLTAGNATAPDLEGPLSGEDFSNLIGVINEGAAYVNVHTVDFPDGEIRGTIVNSSLLEVPSISP
ncbi:MAG TPA: CHRD domain-containing protein [Nitrososphaeraceae archaeon]|nr:CHRD domain-containing protein [Nitrososphaeraceae archaeon]